jgi:hypothetical protein
MLFRPGNGRQSVQLGSGGRQNLQLQKEKKSVGEFDKDADDEGADNPLAVLQVELDAEDEVNSENLSDWLKKLHMRTQHLVDKVTVNGMSRLADTNNVATALTRSIQCPLFF